MRTPPSAPRPGGFDVEQAAPVDIDPLVYAAFLEYDRDHSGAISREEAAKMIKALALPVSDNYVQRTWDAYDTDGSGVLDLQEFAVMMKEGIFRNALHLVKTPGHSTAPVAPTRTGSTRPPATPLQVVGNPLAQQPPAVAPRPSGGVTTLRVSAQHEELEESETPAEALFRAVDRDGDGQISFQEFASFWTERQLATTGTLGELSLSLSISLSVSLSLSLSTGNVRRIRQICTARARKGLETCG